MVEKPQVVINGGITMSKIFVDIAALAISVWLLSLIIANPAMTASVAWKIGLAAINLSFGFRLYEGYKESKK